MSTTIESSATNNILNRTIIPPPIMQRKFLTLMAVFGIACWLNAPGVSAAAQTAAANGQNNGNNAGQVIEPTIVHSVQPAYPRSAFERKLTGIVTLRIDIDRAGNVRDVRVLSAKPRGVFERSAVQAALRYKFSPKTEGGQPVPAQIIQDFVFSLETSEAATAPQQNSQQDE